MSSIELKIEYSIDLEIKRVKKTLAKIDWYKSNGYSPTLPSDIDKGIENSIKDEYAEEIFDNLKTQIMNRWNVFSSEFSTKLESSGLKCQDEYYIKLTKYGVRGSYKLPNIIILNIRDRELDDIIRTILHEIIHLSIEKWIRVNQIPHWQKERFVDLIFDRIYPKINKMREPKENSQVIDSSFNKYYPDIEKIIKKLKNP